MNYVPIFLLSLAALCCTGGAGPSAVAYADVSERGYTQRVAVSGANHTTIYVSGQVPVDSTGALVGAGDLEQQTAQVFENIRAQVVRAGGSMDDLVSIDCYFTDIARIAEFRAARDKFINLDRPPTSTAVQVDRLINQEFMIEISAVAVIQHTRK